MSTWIIATLAVLGVRAYGHPGAYASALSVNAGRMCMSLTLGVCRIRVQLMVVRIFTQESRSEGRVCHVKCCTRCPGGGGLLCTARDVMPPVLLVQVSVCSWGADRGARTVSRFWTFFMLLGWSPGVNALVYSGCMLNDLALGGILVSC